jgi:hypothetical protein
MRAFVHFSVGVSGMLFCLLFIELEPRHEFLALFASGLWALVPDLGWLLLRIGLPGSAALWKQLFNSLLGNLFWFHPVLDAIEPENRVFEMVGGFALLGLAVSIYYLLNDWDQMDSHTG